jgi:hypothetical protein
MGKSVSIEAMGAVGGDAGGLAERTLRWFAGRPWRRIVGTPAPPVAWPRPTTHTSWRQSMHDMEWFEDGQGAGREPRNFVTMIEPWDTGLVRFALSIGSPADLPAVMARLRRRAALALRVWGIAEPTLSPGLEKAFRGLLAERAEAVDDGESHRLADLWCGCISYLWRVAMSFTHDPRPVYAAGLMHALAVCDSAAAFIRGRADERSPGLDEALPTWFAIICHDDRAAAAMTVVQLGQDGVAAAEAGARGIVALADLGDVSWLLTATGTARGAPAGAAVSATEAAVTASGDLRGLADSFVARALLPRDLAADGRAVPSVVPEAESDPILRLEGWMTAAPRLLRLLMPSISARQAPRPAEDALPTLRPATNAITAFADYACNIAPTRGIAFAPGDAALALPGQAAALAMARLHAGAGAANRAERKAWRIASFAKQGVPAGQTRPLAERPAHVALLRPVLDDPRRLMLDGLAGTALADVAALFGPGGQRPRGDAAIGFASLVVLGLMHLAAEAMLGRWAHADGHIPDDGAASMLAEGVGAPVNPRVQPLWLARAAVDLDLVAGAPLTDAERRLATAVTAAMLLAAALALGLADQRNILIQLMERNTEPWLDSTAWRDRVGGLDTLWGWGALAPSDDAATQRVETKARGWLTRLKASAVA